jgi:hypothetical protein
MKRLRIVPAFLAILTLMGAPAMAQADDRHRDHGLYVKLSHDGGFWFGYRRHAAQHGYVDHGREYRRVQRELIEKRTRLLNRTRHALEQEELEQTQRRLGRLMAADQELREHREGHRHCHH